MSRHQKRLSVPNSWPVERKTAKYTVKARAGPHGENGVPLVILLRDVLGYVDSTKEAKYAVNEGNVLVNGEPVRDVRRPIGMFDILAFEEREEHYRVFPDEGGRLALTPIDAEDADGKLGKIVDKRQVPGGATQLQLHDGRNLRVEDGSEYSGKDSIVIGFEDSEERSSSDDSSGDEPREDGGILAHFVYEEGALVTAVRGQHAGEIGRVEAIEVIPSSAPNTVTVETDDGTFETVEKYIVVIDENFVGDAEQRSADRSSGDEPREDDEDAAADGGEEE